MFVSSPSGFACDKWYLPVEGTVGGFDFELRPWAPSAEGRDLAFVHISDSEISCVDDRERAWAKRVKDIADEVDA